MTSSVESSLGSTGSAATETMELTQKTNNNDKKQLIESEEAHAMSNSEAMMNLLKATVGVGVLALPLAFKNAGLWVGFFGLFFIGCISLHNMHLLFSTSRRLSTKLGHTYLDYDRVAAAAFKVGPESLRRFSTAAGWVVNVFLVITQAGYGSVLMIFISDTVQQVVECKTDFDMDKQLWILITFASLLIYVFIRTLKYLAPLALVANVGIVIALIIIFQYVVRDMPPASDYPAFNSWKTLPLYFGTAVFSVESIALVLPIGNQMKYPKEFLGWNGVLNTAIIIVMAVYAALAFYGYMKFGDDIEASITFNLPSDEWLYVSVQLMFALSAYVSFGLQFYVLIQIVWLPIQSWLENETLRKCGEYLIRFILTCFMYLLAAAVPHLDLMVSLLGSVALSGLVLVFPPIFHILSLWDSSFGRYRWKLFKDIFIACFGFLGFVVGTAVSLMKIIEEFSDY